MKKQKKKPEKKPKLCHFERPLKPICLKKEETATAFSLEGEGNPIRLLVETEILPPHSYNKVVEGKYIVIDPCLLCLINGKPGIKGFHCSDPETVFSAIEHYERINATYGVTRSTYEFIQAAIDAHPEVVEEVDRNFEQQRQDLIQDMQEHGYPVDMTIHRRVRDS